MKQSWLKLVARVDALTLRERVIIFLMAALAVVAVVDFTVLGRQEAEQQRVAKRIQDEQNEIQRIRAEIQQKVTEGTNDPNGPVRERLRVLQAQGAELKKAVAGMQTGLVSPDKMAALLEGILRRNTSLRMVSLKKLPSASVIDIPTEASVAVSDEGRVGGLYRHGVQLTVQGTYLDMVNYLHELETLSSQVFWGDIEFAVNQHPNATMTMTVYTLSLDKQWLSI